MSFITLTNLGLILNAIGSFMVAISFGENLGGAYQNDKKGKPIYLASFLRPKSFRIGLLIMGVGFVLQIFK
jgi:hypothetical protein